MTTTSAVERDRSAEIAVRLSAIVAEVLKLDAAALPISESADLYELGLESLSVVALLSSIEAAFDITIDVEDLSTELFGRFGKLVEFVRGKADDRSR